MSPSFMHRPTITRSRIIDFDTARSATLKQVLQRPVSPLVMRAAKHLGKLCCGHNLYAVMVQ